MKSVDEILQAVKQLDAARSLSLRRKMDRLEKQLWAEELKRTSAEMFKNGLTDDAIDSMAMRRRREGRR